MELKKTDLGLQLIIHEDSHEYSYFVDFLSAKSEYRRLHGGGRSQLIAKAVGIKPKQTLKVLDVTAGFGQDAYVLACLGCEMTLLERSPIIYQLLEDGLQRARENVDFRILKMQLYQFNAIDYLNQLGENNYPDVIYVDPMFPVRQKSALVKKEMRMLKAVVGEDVDADKLLSLALKKAKKRVVVKRPKLAPPLSSMSPDLVFKGKSSRYDVYLSRQVGV